MKKIVLTLAGILMMAAATFAQGPKLGYVNSQELLQMMPEMTKSEAELRTLAKSYEDQLVTMNQELEKKFKDFQAGEKTMTEAVREVKGRELQDLQARMESTKESAQEKIQKRKEELYKPILERADKAIREVAKEKAYDYIFDASAGSLLYAKESENVLEAVKTKLGIKAGAASAATATKPK